MDPVVLHRWSSSPALCSLGIKIKTTKQLVEKREKGRAGIAVLLTWNISSSSALSVSLILLVRVELDYSPVCSHKLLTGTGEQCEEQEGVVREPPLSFRAMSLPQTCTAGSRNKCKQFSEIAIGKSRKGN